MKIATIAVLAIFCSLIGYSCVMMGIKNRDDYNKANRWRLVKLDQTSYGTPEFFKQALEQSIVDDTKKFYFQPYHDLYFWNCAYSPEMLALLLERWELQPQRESHPLIQKSIKESPPELQSLLSSGEELDCYVSKIFVEGEKGHQISVIWNKSKNRILVRDYYNF